MCKAALSLGLSLRIGNVTRSISPQIAAFVTTPFDVIKTHRQIEFGERFLYPDTAAKAPPVRTTYEMFVRIKRQSGIRGLFAGVAPRLFKISPACAIMIGSFEYGKAFFHERNVSTYHSQVSLTTAVNNSAADIMPDRLSEDVATTLGTDSIIRLQREHS